MKPMKKKPTTILDMTVFEVSLAHQPRNAEDFILVKDKEDFEMKKLLAYLAAKGADVPEVVKKELGDAPDSLTFAEVTKMLKDAGFNVDSAVEEIVKDGMKDIFNPETQIVVAKDSVIVNPTTHHYVPKDGYEVTKKDIYAGLAPEVVTRLKDNEAAIRTIAMENLSIKLKDKVGAAEAETLLKMADTIPAPTLLSFADMLATKDKIITDLGKAKGNEEEHKDMLDGSKRDAMVKEIMEKDGVDQITALTTLAQRGFYIKEA